MHFQVSRNGQMYGPYTLQDLQRYVASGNVLPTDLAKSEDMPEWLPVSQILGQQAAPAAPAFPASATPSPFASDALAATPVQPQSGYQPPYLSPFPAAGAGPLAASRYPDAPNLNWGLVLLIGIFFNLFFIIWDFVQASWLQKVQPTSTALRQYIIAYVVMFASAILAVAAGGFAAVTNQNGSTPGAGFVVIILIAVLGYFVGLVMIFVARFSERTSLEQHFNGAEPVGLKLSGVMTFFFGSLYFQYHLNRINALKQASRMGYPAPYQGS